MSYSPRRGGDHETAKLSMSGDGRGRRRVGDIRKVIPKNSARDLGGAKTSVES